MALRQRKWLHRLVTAEVLQPLFLHAFAMSHLFTNLRCIPLSVLLAFIGEVLLVGSSGMETLKNFAYRPYIADILAVLKIVGSTAAALSLVLYLIRRTRAPFTRQSLAMIGLHAGLLAMVVSMGLDFALGFKGFVYIREGESAATWFDDAGNERPLGFLVQCLNFKLDVYPGTTRPERYASTIRFSSSRDDTVPASSLLLAVNSPQSYQGVTFYQQDCGLAPRKDSAVEVKAAVRDREMSYLIAIGEPIQLTDGTFLLIEDFSPTITFVKGRPQTIDADQMRNPGYLIRLVRPSGEDLSHWVMPYQNAKWIEDDLVIEVGDFKNLEYTVLSVAKTPFAWLFYAGGLVAGLSLLLYTFITFGSRSFSEASHEY